MITINYKSRKKKLFNEILKISYENNLPHIGTCLSCLEILMNIFYKQLNARDYFLLSKGHAAVALYAILKDLGKIEKIDIDYLWEHPRKDLNLGIVYSSGSLGHGLSVGAGLALAKPKSKIYVLMGDGECEEGSVWEAANFAIKNNLTNLVPIIDANGMSQFQKIDRESLAPKWRGFGWAVNEPLQDEVWNLSFKEIVNQPTAWIVHTIKGRGLPYMEDKLISHYLRLNLEQYNQAIRA
jgi:transketolase